MLPLAQAPTELLGFMRDKMEGVAETRPDIVEAVARHQPYDHLWLRHLSKLTRVNKHRYLSAQRREVRDEREPVFEITADWPPILYPANGWMVKQYVHWRFIDPDAPVFGCCCRHPSGSGPIAL